MTTTVATKPPTQIETRQSSPQTLKDFFEANKGKIAEILPKHLTPERLCKVALLAASRDPKLALCHPLSLLRATMEAAAVGLEPNTPLQHAWLIPYNNTKNRTMDAQFQIGYRGLVELARRSGQIKSVSANVVRAEDLFEYEDGLDVKLRHVPNFDVEDRGAIKYVYAIAHFKDGGHQHDVMTIHEVEAIRKRSKSPNYGPWQDHFAEMAKKTVLKRLCKLLPMAVEAARVIEVDDEDRIVEAKAEAAPVFDLQSLATSSEDRELPDLLKTPPAFEFAEEESGADDEGS